MDQVLQFIDKERARFVDELATWVKIPAISADPAHKEDMRKNALHLIAELKRLKRAFDSTLSLPEAAAESGGGRSVRLETDAPDSTVTAYASVQGASSDAQVVAAIHAYLARSHREPATIAGSA